MTTSELTCPKCQAPMRTIERSGIIIDRCSECGGMFLDRGELEAEIVELDAILKRLVAETAPELVARVGIGTECASALLVAAGDNPERLRSEATFAHLCGASPIDASSGKHERHRLNRGGDRQANSALWKIVITRMVCDPRTRDYIERRVKDGLIKREAIRCLKRYIAREVYNALPNQQLALD